MSSTYYQSVTKPRTKWLQIAVAAGAAIALTAGIAARSFAVADTEVSAIDGTQGWAEWHRDTGSVNISSDLGAPTGFGTSSLKFDTPLSNDKAYVQNTALQGDLLSSLNEISYNTYRAAASTAPTGQVPSLNIEIANSDGSGYTTLVYEPTYQTGGAAAVTSGSWQAWDAYSGGNAIWWSTRDIDGVFAGGGTAPYNQRYVKLADIVAANPDAHIISVAINQGGGNGGLVAGADGLKLNGSTYDFETAAATPVVNGENFNTHSAADYQGVNVGFNVANFDSLESVTVSLLDANRNVIVTNTGTQDLFDLYAAGTSQFSTPFITSLGNYDLAGDTYWNFGAWKSTAKPVYAVITVNGITTEITPLTEPDGVLFSSLQFTASDKEACMNNGWKVFSAKYKNQGQCVASVTANEHSKLRREQ